MRDKQRNDPVEVRVTAVSHHFEETRVLKEISLSVQPGEFLTFLGPSGSGKSTLLNIIGGLVEPSSGQIWIGGEDVTNIPTHKRGVGFVFQHYALFPHMNVFENVSYPLRVRRLGKAETSDRVFEALKMVRLEDFAERRPHQLSGGQQQRVALARAVVFRPRVLLMDEPLGALDKHLRLALQTELRALQQELGITTVYVTHDQAEAFSMSDRIAVMAGGSLLQVASSRELYDTPADPFVARFVGHINEFPGTSIRPTAEGMEISTFAGLFATNRLQHTGAVVCGLRPEAVRFTQTSLGRVKAKIMRIVYQGGRQQVEMLTSTGVRLLAEVDAKQKLAAGDEIGATWADTDVHVFPLVG